MVRCPSPWRISARKLKRCKKIDCKKPKPNANGCVVGCAKCRLKCLLKISVVRTETKTNIDFTTEARKAIYKKLDCLKAKVTRCEYTFVKIVKTNASRRLKAADGVSFNVGATYTCDDDDDAEGCTAAQEKLVAQPDKHSTEVVSGLQDESAFQGTQPTLEREKTEQLEPVTIETIEDEESTTTVGAGNTVLTTKATGKGDTTMSKMTGKGGTTAAKATDGKVEPVAVVDSGYTNKFALVTVTLLVVVL